MVVRLAEALEIPLRVRNALLLTAGYAPAYGEAPLDEGELPLLTTLTRFGTAVDASVSELRLEAFLPADDATAARMADGL